MWAPGGEGHRLLLVSSACTAHARHEEQLVLQIPAILNDTVSTLIALRYSQPDTTLGIILGTGTNCALLEKIDRWVSLAG
jgi:hexokinase